MPQIIIDDVRIQVESGKTIIEAAEENNIQIPHFCWHPELSVSGNCRMCLVDVGLPKRLPDGSFEKDSLGNPVIMYFPKLSIACATQISDGMNVLTQSKRAVEARQSVMEFLLINHPLDCPICDEAGQCKLQEYAFNHSSGSSRFDEVKNYKPKRVEWSDKIIFDAERCISCSRCIRFATEVAEQDVIGFVNRNDHVTIQLVKGEKFDNPYSMNVIDICPVGALTSSDFRFKARVWDMSFNDSICTGCSRGCNIKLGIRNNEILRVEPRTNMYVNKYWMCDFGRLNGYEKINSNRTLDPIIKNGNGQNNNTWELAYDAAAYHLRKIKSTEIMFIGSPYATNEDNYILQKFAKKIIKSHNIDFIPRIDNKFADGKLSTSDITPNSKGASIFCNLGTDGIKINSLVEKINTGSIKALYLMEDDLSAFPELLKVLSKLELFIIHASNNFGYMENADIIIPATTYAESEGTFININDRVQHFSPALVTKENLRFMGMKQSRLDKFGAENDRWTHSEQRNCRQSWRSLQNIANLLGAGWAYKSSKDIFNEIAGLYSQFQGMTYDKLDEYSGLVLGKGEQPDPKLFAYQSHVMKPE
ncbi:MAG: nuoG [Ignavibacteria bacterium]|nr:nuoG [Ignavibacteria bacterium]